VRSDTSFYVLHALVAFSHCVPRLAHIDIGAMHDDDSDDDEKTPTTVSTLDARALADLMSAFPRLRRFTLPRRCDRVAVAEVLATLAPERQRNVVIEQ
jgi:hypothetical protein